MEFVMKLDDDFKQEYFRFNAGCVAQILKDKLHQQSSSGVNNLWWCSALLVPPTFVLVPACSALMVVYGPICKP
eukprot:scaffold6074_cov70-Phaeocystis_antarctica.AAC.1